MRGSLPLLATLLLLMPRQVTADELSVVLRPGVAEWPCTVTGFVTRGVDGTAHKVELREPVTVTSTPSMVRVVAPEAAVEVTAVAEDCWTEPRPLPSAETPLTIDIWPRAIVAGEVVSERGAPPPRVMTGTFVDAGTGREEVSAAMEHAAQCSLEGRTWRCVVPARRPLHLRLAVDDFAPLYVWDLEARDTKTAVGTGIHSLLRGGSIVGRVVTDRRAPVTNASVTLAAVTAAHQAAADRQLTAPHTRSDAKGYFQFVGVVPGRYRLVSKVEGRGDAIGGEIEVRRGQDLRAEELVHAPMAELELIVSPPVSGAQRRWRVVLRRATGRMSEMMRLAEETVGADGVWTRGNLQPGSYLLTLLDAESEVAQQIVELHGGPERLLIAVDGIDVEGRVVSGDRGVEAKVRFDFSGRRVEATSDADGRFAVTFPIPGKWLPAVRVPPNGAEVRLAGREITAPQEGELLLELPGGRISGKVVDAEGRPAAAAVHFRRDGKVAAQTMTDDDGTFELIGLAAGVYSADAESDDGFAGPMSVSVDEERETAIELRVAALRELTGQVVTADGMAASGAIVRFVDDSAGTYEDVIADGRGVYSLEIKPAVESVAVIVIAPPHPVALRRLRVSGKRSVSAPPIQLAPLAAKLRLGIGGTPPWPTISGPDGRPYPVVLLLAPRFGLPFWREFVNGAYELSMEPGTYRLCNEKGGDCRTASLAPNAETLVNFVGG